MNMSSIIFSGVLVVALFLVMLAIKTDVQSLVEKREDLIAEKARLEESIRVLKLEYAYLTRPEQLNSFSKKLALQPISPEAMEVLSLEVGE